jgi:hypothetical protein
MRKTKGRCYLPEILMYCPTSNGSVQWNSSRDSSICLAPELLIMASPISPEEETNSRVTVAEVLHDLQNEQAHKPTGEQYPTEIWNNSLSIISLNVNTKHNVMRKSIKRCTSVAPSREEELHLRYFIISFSKTRTQLGLFQVLQRKNKSFFILSVREQKRLSE